MLSLISTFVLCLITVGILTRRAPQLHLRFMSAAFLTDLGLVIYIEATRHAVNKVIHQSGPLLGFHVTVSVLVLVAYVLQILIGSRLLLGEGSRQLVLTGAMASGAAPVAGGFEQILFSRRTHIIVGSSFCCLRLLNYITSFML